MNNHTTRRQVLFGGAGIAAGALLTACTSSTTSSFVSPSGAGVARAEKARRTTGRVTRTSLTSGKAEIDLAGRTASTWAYNDAVPGPVLRARAGDTIRAQITNNLPMDTSIHWHGLAIRNDMDGVPPLTQEPITPGSNFEYEFAVDTPGTYWFHPHVGPQLDRGLYAPIVIEDPREPLSYDEEWVLVLDDWLDGVTATPEKVLDELQDGMGHMDSGHGMGGMDSNSSGPRRKGNTLMGATSPVLGGDAGDVYYPYYLINGRPKADPETFEVKPGQRIRLRIINASGDTAFRFAIGDHTLTVTHTDGYPVTHADSDSILLGMGERYDALVTCGDGAFPVVAQAEGKDERAFAVLRTSSAATPSPESTVAMSEPVTASTLNAAQEVTLGDRPVDRHLDLSLTGGMMKYDWGVNDRPYDPEKPMAGALRVREGERVQLTMRNRTMMWHPFHVHGHTYQHADGGPRKDTSIIRPQENLTVVFDTHNPGLWMTHCLSLIHI